MPPFLAGLHYLRNRVDDCRLLREMDVVVRAGYWRATFVTAKGWVAKYIEQRGGVYRLLRRSGLQIHLSSSHPVRLVGSEAGWLTYLYEPLA